MTIGEADATYLLDAIRSLSDYGFNGARQYLAGKGYYNQDGEINANAVSVLSGVVTTPLLDGSGAVVKLKELGPGYYRPDSGGFETFTTKNGEAVFRYLTPQKYTVEEAAPPSGYTKDTPKSVTVTEANDVGNAAKLAMQDAPLALVFDKSDGLTDKPLDGCTFALQNTEGEVVWLKKVKEGVYRPDGRVIKPLPPTRAALPSPRLRPANILYPR